MTILINGKPAALKAGSSFDFVAENRLFTGSDSYTLAISFPLRGCQQNIDIFGNIHRSDMVKAPAIYDCVIQDKSFCRTGTITITEVSEAEVKTQFLEGRSAENFYSTFDDIYIDELALGSGDAGGVTDPEQLWKSIDDGNNYVPLPWVNDYSGNIQNAVSYDADTDKYTFDSARTYTSRTGSSSTSSPTLSYQPYLIYIVRQICSAVGYSIDLSPWEQSDLRFLLVCNTLPYAWHVTEFARALPHWTLTEFFEKLEHFLACEFDIDHKAKAIAFAFSKDIASEQVRLEKVLDEYSAEVSVEEQQQSSYRAIANIRYSDCDHEMWKYYSCRWFLENQKDRIVSYDTLAELIEDNKELIRTGTYSYGNANYVLYAADVDRHFMLRCVGSEQTEYDKGFSDWDYYWWIERLVPLNAFGDRVIDEDSGNDLEIDFVPAWLDDTDEEHGDCLFLSFGDYDEEYSTRASSSTSTRTSTVENAPHASTSVHDESGITQSGIHGILEAGEKEGNAEYYSQIFIAFWDGNIPRRGSMPFPAIDRVHVFSDWTYITFPYTLSLTENAQIKNAVGEDIDANKKYTFSFLADEIPNPRAIFYINGGKYVCEKITATFTENGMSQRLKGVFYRVP